MTKMKGLLLCISTAILTAGVLLSTLEFKVNHNAPALNVVGPATARLGDLVEFKAAVSNASWFSRTVYQWKIIGSQGEVIYKTLSPNDIFFPAGMTGDKLHIITSAVNYDNYILWNNVYPLDMVSNVVIVGDGPVPPGPGPVPPGPTPPPPPPPPGPTPVTEHLYVIAVFDNTQATSLTPDQLKLHNSTTISGVVNKLNATWKNYDKANPALADATWQTTLQKTGVPALIIANDKGKVFYSGKAIGEADVSTQLNALRAGGK